MTGAPSTLVISLTPFDEHDRLDVEAFRSHLRRMRDAGIGVYVGGGGSGEGYTLTPAEAFTVLRRPRSMPLLPTEPLRSNCQTVPSLPRRPATRAWSFTWPPKRGVKPPG